MHISEVILASMVESNRQHATHCSGGTLVKSLHISSDNNECDYNKGEDLTSDYRKMQQICFDVDT